MILAKKPRVSPIDGWGFFEAIDGKLSKSFEIHLAQAGIDIGSGILGWRGTVLSKDHKYENMSFEMSPRHENWTGVVVIRVFDGDKQIYDGMADTSGLKCEWK
ncbi:hypothetical protein [Parasphingorhabdus sp.]|uniref:hypothetical protein n=1 Tax=Parasphingorhabdus sp. TaxID=2709688 RepID=UPI003D2830C5